MACDSSRPSFIVAFCFASFLPSLAVAQAGPEQIVMSANSVVDEAMAIPAKRIPETLLAEARAVAIIPNVVKGGFVVGVRHGRGVVLIRDDEGRWNPPMFATLTGGSVGWQAGLQATDVILVFMTRRGVNGLMNGKFTIGADAAAAAGPLGRQASAATDARLEAEILSYSRSRGLFAGVSIDGSVLQLDHMAGHHYYGGPILSATGQVIEPRQALPVSAVQLMDKLARYSGAEHSMAETPIGPDGMVAPTRADQMEIVRRRLEASWQRLAALLDRQWQEYLAPPQLLSGNSSPIDQLREKLDRYAAISSDVKYRALAENPHFTATHQLLREYATLLSSRTPAKLALPPPPAADRSRY